MISEDNYKYDIEALLEGGEIIQIWPKGYSMYPMFVPGRDAAIISKADAETLRRNDVVLYRRKEGKLVLHRIWRRKADGFYLVGDNQVEIEGPIEPQQIKGILRAFVRKGRKISVCNPIYRLAAGGWLCLRPIRFAITRPLARLKRAWRREK